jgi:cell division protein FtsX
LVPVDSVAGRALSAVIAILTFLAALSAGAALLAARASEQWRGAVANEMTIQVRPILAAISSRTSRAPSSLRGRAEHRRGPAGAAGRIGPAARALARLRVSTSSNCRCHA